VPATIHRMRIIEIFTFVGMDVVGSEVGLKVGSDVVGSIAVGLEVVGLEVVGVGSAEGIEVGRAVVGIEVVGAEVGVGIAVVGSEVGRGVVGFEVDGVEVGFEVDGVEVGRAVDGFGVVGALVVGALVGLVVLDFGEVGLGVALAAEAAHGPAVAQQTDAMTKTMDPLAKFIEQVRDGGKNFPSTT